MALSKNPAIANRPEKRCPRCEVVKVRADYHTRGASSDGMAPYCKVCANARRVERRERGLVTPGSEERFWKYVERSGGPDACWHWLGGKVSDGYGRFHYAGKEVASHHMPLIFAGITPPKYPMVCDHLCRNRGCVNPKHIRIVHQGTNTLENSLSRFALNRAKTHCTKCGNPFAGENLAIIKVGRNKRDPSKLYTGRVCLTCYPTYWRHAVIPRPRPAGSRIKRTDPDFRGENR